MAAELPPGLSALFGPPKKAAAPKPAPKPAGPGAGDFFAMMKKTRAVNTSPPAPAAPSKPFEVPEIRKVKPPPPIFDLAALARGAMKDEAEAVRRAAGAPQAPAPASNPFAGMNAPTGPPLPRAGLFKGITKAGESKKKEPPKLKIPTEFVPTLKDLFGLEEEPTFRKGSKIEEARRREGVKDSSELRRILAIKRRPLASSSAPDLTDRYRKASGTMRLFRIQSAALFEMRNAGGLFGPCGVGSGKTLISLLAQRAMDSKQTVILVPPALKAQLQNVDIPRLAKQWQIDLARIRVVTYNQLSSASSADILEEIKPDLIVADEAHNLRYRTAARTKRFLRYMKANPGCRFVGLSGTMTRKSLNDYQHLAELALGKNSPLPNHYPTLADWAEAIDVSDDPMPPGALLQFCTDEELAEIAKLSEDLEAEGVSFKIQDIVRKAFRRRVVETPGVVATEESALGTSLIINAARPKVPPDVLNMIADVRGRWVTPDGDELTDALSVARITRQLAAGFYYRPVWPGGIPDVEWLTARREWNKEVREILRLSRKGLDSPMLIASAIERGDYKSEFYDAWKKVKDRPEPPREAVWVNDFLVREAIEWVKNNAAKTTPALVWYSHDAFGRKLAELSGLPFFGPGSKASEELTKVDAKKTPAIIVSARAHGTGKNLQTFSLNLITTPISSGADAEQLIARTHRPGQEADEVRVDVFVHTPETLAAFRSSVRDAGYIEATQGQRQKLNFAERLGFGADAFEFGNKTAEEIETDGIVWGGGIADLFKR